MSKLAKRTYLALILLFLYIPIVVLIFQSFNAGKSRAKWEGFSFRWYAELFQDQAIMAPIVLAVTKDIDRSRIVIAAILTFYPVATNTLSGFKSVEREKRELMYSYAAKRYDIYRKLMEIY